MDDRYAGRLRLVSTDLAEPVLERIVAALAARVDLPFDRLSDAQVLSSAIVASALPRSPDGILCVEFATGRRDVALHLGPFPPGGAAEVMADSALPGVGIVLERLVNHWSIDPLDSGDEMLRLRIGDGASASG